MWSSLSDRNPLTNIIQLVDFVFGFNDSKFIELMFISFLSDAIFSNIFNIFNFLSTFNWSNISFDFKLIWILFESFVSFPKFTKISFIYLISYFWLFFSGR